MALSALDAREAFHFLLLRDLALRLSGRSWAVKGGICLRFFHRSPRLSEDMDLDVEPGVRSGTLARAVDGALQARSLAASLLPVGIEAVSFTKPKQTETVQRWKVALLAMDRSTLQTKIEFSRRRDPIAWKAGQPVIGLAASLGAAPFVANFYPAREAARQKVAALASPNRVAARDLFDLHHLFTAVGVASAELAGSPAVEAAGKAEAFTLRDFQAQVAPFLPAGLAAHYSGPAEFAALRDGVVARLLEVPA